MPENEKKEEKRITLQEVINKTDDFLEGEITQEEFGKFGTEFAIRAYLTMKEKMEIMIIVTTNLLCADSDIKEIKIAETEKILFFFGLLD